MSIRQNRFAVVLMRFGWFPIIILFPIRCIAEIIEGYADLGIVRQPIEHFREYSQICLLRVEAEPAVKEAAVSYVSEHLGQVFYPVAFKSGQRTWNCTKIMWKAYQILGIDFDDNNDLWVSPDSIYDSRHVTVIRENGLLWF